MVRKNITKKSVLLFFILVTVVIASCDLFLTSPFPEYLGNVLSEYDLSDTIDPLYDEGTRVRYEFISMQPDGIPNDYLFFMLTPSTDITDTSAPKPRLLLYNEDGTFLNEIVQPTDASVSGLNAFFSRPFFQSNSGHAPQSRILGGRLSFNLFDASLTDSSVLGDFQFIDHSLAGYGANIYSYPTDVTRQGSYLFSESGGSNGSFTLFVRGYTDDTLWVPHDIPPNESATVNIIPSNEHLSTDEITESEEPVGFRLRGVIDLGTSKLFLLEYLPDEKLMLWTLTDDEIVIHSTGAGDSTSIEARNSSNTRNNIDMTDGYVYYTNTSILIRKEAGWFERYDLNGNFQDKIITESGSGILYGFSVDDDYMYRFDPETSKLLVMNTWW